MANCKDCKVDLTPEIISAVSKYRCKECQAKLTHEIYLRYKDYHKDYREAKQKAPKTNGNPLPCVSCGKKVVLYSIDQLNATEGLKCIACHNKKNKQIVCKDCGVEVTVENMGLKYLCTTCYKQRNRDNYLKNKKYYTDYRNNLKSEKIKNEIADEGTAENDRD